MRILACIVALVATGCQQDDKVLVRKLDDLSTQVGSLDRKVSALQLAGARGAAPPRRPEPDSADVYAVPVDGSPSVGPADALVTIVEGYEYACPACQKVRNNLEQVRAKYADRVRVVYKTFLVHGDDALPASLAACAAHRQGRFEALDRLLWDKGFAGGRDFSPAKLTALAREAGLDVAKFEADVAGACKEIVARDHAALAAVGQRATPTFFVNGRYLVGAQPPERFAKVIDEELAKAEARVAQGTPRARYYDTWVVGQGRAKFEPKP